ncbi:VWA domain-containing protein [Knoellia aerolata]|uniref:von Willebrand factor A n=1 Tax=Knoellia aerolata DSM 18566 TaxID=1385519 RepID=A0A0A0JT52_9MICO|nr:VWA domain-containing protein [Knoellia aerolata]KGN40575.1 von Willebrand factor A [Knoellia aerolata DSM 18566]
MALSWPWALLVVAVVPALLALQWWRARRRKRGAVLVSSVALVRSVQPGTTRWRRVVPPALLLLALVALGVAAARPHREANVSSTATTILLAMDVSRSMCSTDVDPNRLQAAQQAAIDFIEAQPEGSRIGLVTFAGFATVAVPPTDDTEALGRAVESLVTGRGTAIGQGILTSIDAIAELDPSVAPTGADVPDSATRDDAAAVIVVLTDGSNRNGVDPATAAEQAADRGIRVYTIGFGSEVPAPSVCNADQVVPGGGFGAGPGGLGGRGVDRSIDEETLQGVADLTGGTYYRAESADQLTDALADLPQHIATGKESVDVAVWFAALAGVLAAGAFAMATWLDRAR